MVSFSDYDVEINKIHTKSAAAEVEEDICLADEIKELIVYAKEPKEVEVLVDAYTKLYNMNRRYTF